MMARRAVFPLVRLEVATHDNRLVNAAEVRELPLPVHRAMDDEKRDRWPAGEIKAIIVRDGWIIGVGSLADDLAVGVLGGGQIAAEVDGAGIPFRMEGEMFVTDMLTIHAATIGTSPCWDDCWIRLGDL